MKNKNHFTNSLLLFVFVLISFNSNSQSLWGLTTLGGDSGGGVMFKYDVSTQKDSIVKSFPLPPATPYYSNFIQATNGNLYGVTSAGGVSNMGTIFKLIGGNDSILVSFYGTN